VTPRPRLLVVASTFPAGHDDGTPAFVRDLALEVSGEFDTVVLVPRVPDGPRRERQGSMSVRRFRYFPHRWEDLADGAILENLRSRRSRWIQVLPFVLAEAWALRRAVHDHRPDVIHLHWMIPQGIAALVVARSVPWVVTTLGGDVYALRDPLSRRLKRAILRRARAVTTMNEDMRRRLVDLGAPPGRTYVLPMGVDLAGVRSAAVAATRTPGRILFVGRLVEKKGLAVLLDALRLLPADRSWTLDVVGDGPLRPALEAAARGLAVRFLGQQGREQLYGLYAEVEVVAVPSVPAASGDQDGLPLVLLEAMGAGAALVGSDLPGINEAVIDGVSGVLVPHSDPAALADALGRVLGDENMRQRLGEQARTAADHFSLTNVGARYRDVLREAIAIVG